MFFFEDRSRGLYLWWVHKNQGLQQIHNKSSSGTVV